MTADLPGPSPVMFKDRRGWLIAFGVFEILIACFCLLLVLLVVVALSLPQHGNPQLSPQNSLSPALQIISAVLVYGGMAAVFLTIGVGSIRCKNWARIAMLVVSGFWLGMGVLTTLVIMLVVPSIMRQQGRLSPEALHGVILVMTVFTCFFMVVMPAVFLFFYSRKSVKATCLVGGAGQALAPVTTTHHSNVPVPVIILATLQGLGIFSVFGFLVVRATVLFGTVLHGTAAFITLLVVSTLSGYAAWSIYQRKLVGWTIALSISLFSLASTIVTFAGHDMLQIYREMGLSEQQMQAFQQLPQLQSMLWFLMLPGATAYFAFLVYTRKYFGSAGPDHDLGSVRP